MINSRTPVDVLVIGGGNPALCAAITACRAGANVLVRESAKNDFRGGNSRHTRAIRYFAQGLAWVLSFAAYQGTGGKSSILTSRIIVDLTTFLMRDRGQVVSVWTNS